MTSQELEVLKPATAYPNLEVKTCDNLAYSLFKAVPFLRSKNGASSV